MKAELSFHIKDFGFFCVCLRPILM